MKSDMKASGLFTIKHIRDGEVIWEGKSPNLVVNQGLAYYQSAAVRGGAQISAWYLALFSANRTPQATDTAATVAGLTTELNSQYDEATRPSWTLDAVTGTDATDKTVTNSGSTATFTINSNIDINGAFLISNNTKGGNTGTLMGESLFASTRAAIAGDQVVLTYEIALSS